MTKNETTNTKMMQNYPVGKELKKDRPQLHVLLIQKGKEGYDLMYDRFNMEIITISCYIDSRGKIS